MTGSAKPIVTAAMRPITLAASTGTPTKEAARLSGLFVVTTTRYLRTTVAMGRKCDAAVA